MTAKTKRTLGFSALITATVLFGLAVLIPLGAIVYIHIECRIHSYTKADIKYYEQFLEKDDSDMPHKFYCIGTSDSEQKITYRYLKDMDLDVIPSWEDFLHRDCSWENGKLHA